MTAAKASLLARLTASIEAKQALLSDQDRIATFEAIADTVVAAYRAGGRLYIAGNGGSAADAQHLAAEFVSKLARDRSPLPAEALTVDSSILTAIGNDYGFDKVFSRQVEGKMTTRDIFLGITTSGNSKNILEAVRSCKKLGIRTIVFSGHDGGLVAHEADHCLLAPSNVTSTIQELHIIFAHALCECVENAMFPVQ
ncbi:SIS domain-containing protein [Bradyrhizobium diazoefficiens]|jgi:D-sedoheptulose 7-phosphate isomerase|nr:SIS domain-containing protein [Bradyrhizobium diazoefficiens]MBR0962693.1 SIS domain-containing protein [Bradyrhizobium diazoefficiens]MBR0976853.1 SIS domain-containing protein [Bradyrhizobium diazoefficiens]MBR1005498.1 SIS domain-containing protein [Bradyrhizobium diazoefficiens]MBR1011971.1 SIS domain-containing protein [Bradyrhizobium diazoefficiens]MBR1049312.1 SIS domain-containing protein [Bradyrhizobium diazoefficiens]